MEIDVNKFVNDDDYREKIESDDGFKTLTKEIEIANIQNIIEHLIRSNIPNSEMFLAKLKEIFPEHSKYVDFYYNYFKTVLLILEKK